MRKDYFVASWCCFVVFLLSALGTTLMEVWVKFKKHQSVGHCSHFSRATKSELTLNWWRVFVDLLAVAVSFTGFAYAVGEPFVTLQLWSTTWSPQIGSVALILAHGFVAMVALWNEYDDVRSNNLVKPGKEHKGVSFAPHTQVIFVRNQDSGLP